MDGATLTAALRRIVNQADAEQPVSNVRMLADIVQAETASRRVQAIALGSFALIAFLLAAVGIHGLLSFAVSEPDAGDRRANGTGGECGRYSGDDLRDGLILACLGIGLQSLLAGVQPGDVTTVSCAIILCVLMTLAGSAIPALRAIRLDAATAIRAD